MAAVEERLTCSGRYRRWWERPHRTWRTRQQPETRPWWTGLLKPHKIANLISKLNFYKLIPYPMDNLLNRSAQTGPANAKKSPLFPPAGRSVVLCTPQMAPRTSFLSRQPDVIASFSLSKPVRPLVSWQRGRWEGLVCPLDRVLTYKNLIYLLNLQFYCVNTSYPMDNLLNNYRLVGR